MSDPTNESPTVAPPTKRGFATGATPTRVVVWILGGGFALYLIVTGVVGILTKAR
jgi:hypothetical protein